MDINLLIIALYLLKNIKFLGSKKKSFLENIKDKWIQNSEYIYNINIDERKCVDLNYSKLACDLFHIKQEFLDNYEHNYGCITEIDEKENNENEYSNLIFFYDFIHFYKEVLFYILSEFVYFYKLTTLYLKYINKTLNNCLPTNFKINLNLIKKYCLKEHLEFLYEINTNQINIFIIYILNFNLFILNFL